MKPRIADLFCGAGGAGMGLHRAGFEVVGFDIKPQKNYPFEFHQADALTVDLSGFDAIWASPPCQLYSWATPSRGRYEDFIAPTRDTLGTLGKPYIIENVIGAPLRTTLVLCGKMFGLRVYRHRLFECSFFIMRIPHERHYDDMLRQNNQISKRGFVTVAGNFSHLEYAKQAMGIDWMAKKELAQAIPPAYSEFLGKQLMAVLADDYRTKGRS